jgi:putative transposase
VFEFVEREKDNHDVRLMCRLLGVSPSGFYASRGRPPSARHIDDKRLKELIGAIHVRSRGTYGRPRIKAELEFDHGIRCGAKRVGRLMGELRIHGAHRRRKFRTTIRDEAAAPAPDLVQRVFTASAPNQVWVADIKYVHTGEGFLYIAAVLDLFSRRLVGWAFSTTLHTQLVLDALDMAIQRRNPGDGTVFHSDQGCQYTSLAFGRRLRESGIAASMGSRGDCFDNAAMESFWASLECELLDGNRYATRAAARLAIFDYMEAWYNPWRRHSTLGQISPAEFERRWNTSHALPPLAKLLAQAPGSSPSQR